MNKIIIASRNRGKISEIRKILSLENIEVLDLRALAFNGDIDESGSDFKENALIKAVEVFSRYRLPVLADDSGLSVSYLGGKPGVFSARFAGPEAGDEENNNLLLEKLRGTTEGERKAWFTCAAVFYYDTGRYFYSEGRIDGVITDTPAGMNGFGYDPLFFIPDRGKTMAQLSEDEKNEVSHRAQAFKRINRYIKDYFRSIK